MFPMTVTIHDRAQLSAVLEALSDPPLADVAPKKFKAEKSAPEKLPLLDTQAADVVTYQQAAEAVTHLAKLKGRAELPDVPQERYAALLAACRGAEAA